MIDYSFFSLIDPWITGCDRTLKVGMSAVDVTSDKFPLNYPTDQDIKCTYYISTDDGTGILSFFFSSNNQLDTGASLKVILFIC